MKVSKLQTQKVLTSKCSFTQLSLNMLVTRLTRLYAKNPTDQVLTECAGEINAFLEKYQAIMQKDYDIICKL